MGWPQSEQRSSTWLIWPQAWCRYSTGGPASPASHLSPQATITIDTNQVPGFLLELAQGNPEG